jgi:predicted TIM-barrel fold metal-dependent hydrolase
MESATVSVDAMNASKLWANSGDSHFLEPEGLWDAILPAKQAARMPRSEKISDDEEIVHVDGESFHRKLPAMMTKRGADGLTIAQLSFRPPGARDISARLQDLDAEGIWGEVMYASLGLWSNMIKDQTLVRDAARAQNEWMVSEIKSFAPERLVPAAQMPLLSVDDAVAEIDHIASIGLHVASLPTGVAPGMPDWNDDSWEPLWAAAEEASIVLGFHIGTDGDTPVVFRGPGGAVINYVETTYGGQKVATKLIAGGALDRHPELRVLISEGGATWVPFLGDRMNEGYRQHGMFVRPTLSRLPKEILYRQVYASFQHDESAPAANFAMGYRNVMWGSDYPHLEGTFGHTQETLHELFEGCPTDVRDRVMRGAFMDLFPHVSAPPST